MTVQESLEDVSFSSRWKPSSRIWNKLLVAILMTGLHGLIGCGGSEGIPRYDLAGEITYDGKPVPSGYISFRPDSKKGNRGPGTSAIISDGHYETGPDEGTIGGPHIAIIHGTDGVPYKTEDGYDIPVGRPLFPKYTVYFDLPREPATHALKVPAR